MSKGFTEMTVTELRAFLSEPAALKKIDAMGITVNSKTRKAELIEIARKINADIVTDRLAAQQSAMTTPVGHGIPPVTTPTVDEAHAMIRDFDATWPGIRNLMNAIGVRRIIKAERAAESRYYGVNGRGMGAKHYPMRSNAYMPVSV